MSREQRDFVRAGEKGAFTQQKHGCKKNNQRQQWFNKARKTVKKGQTLDLIRNMDELISGASGERLKNLVRERNYILKAYRRRLLKYNRVNIVHSLTFSLINISRQIHEIVLD